MIDLVGAMILGVVGVTTLICYIMLRGHEKWLKEQELKDEEFYKIWNDPNWFKSKKEAEHHE